MEFAQALAARVLKEKASSNDERLERAFCLCVARKPAPPERQRLLDLLNRELAAFEKSPDEAAALLPKQKEPGLDNKQLAAWTTVSRVLLNLDETITRE